MFDVLHDELFALEDQPSFPDFDPGFDTPEEQEAEAVGAYADQLLAALAVMATRSKRRQADLSAALVRAGMAIDHQRVTAALARLETGGCIEDLVPLYDGGLLMSVTSRGIERLSSAPRWLVG